MKLKHVPNNLQQKKSNLSIFLICTRLNQKWQGSAFVSLLSIQVHTRTVIPNATTITSYVIFFLRSAAPSQLTNPNSSLTNPIATSLAVKRKSCSDAENTKPIETTTKGECNFAYAAPSFKKLAENCTKKQKHQKQDTYDSKQFRSVYRKPLESTLNKLAAVDSSAAASGRPEVSSAQAAAHEAFIRGLLNPKFKIPLPNYVSTSTRALGIKRQGTRQPFYDLDSENVLVLYSPPVLSATELLNVDK